MKKDGLTKGKTDHEFAEFTALRCPPLSLIALSC